MKLKLIFWTLGVLLISGCSLEILPSNISSPSPVETIIKLPEPKLEGEVSLEQALFKRRSVREYSGIALTLKEVAQLLWAGQGKTVEWGGRTAPSAGGIYPLEIYLVTGNVEGLAEGVYRYRPEEHALAKIKEQDVRRELAEAAAGQSFVGEAAIDIIITAIYERTTGKYGDRGLRYVHFEAGHAAQNICLEATALNLGAVTVGAFLDERVIDIIGALSSESPLYIIPVGKKK